MKFRAYRKAFRRLRCPRLASEIPTPPFPTCQDRRLHEEAEEGGVPKGLDPDPVALPGADAGPAR